MADDARVDDLRRLVEQVRAACVEAALTAHEDAAADGLCAEGAWECAVDAMRRLDVATLIPPVSQSSPHQSSPQSTGDQTSMR